VSRDDDYIEINVLCDERLFSGTINMAYIERLLFFTLVHPVYVLLASMDAVWLHMYIYTRGDASYIMHTNNTYSR